MGRIRVTTPSREIQARTPQVACTCFIPGSPTARWRCLETWMTQQRCARQLICFAQDGWEGWRDECSCACSQYEAAPIGLSRPDELPPGSDSIAATIPSHPIRTSCLPTNTNPGHPSRQPRSIPIHSTSIIHSSIRTRLLGQAPHLRNQTIIVIEPEAKYKLTATRYSCCAEAHLEPPRRRQPAPSIPNLPPPTSRRRRDHSSLEHQLAAHLLAMLLLH